MGYLTIEKYELPKRTSHLWFGFMWFILLVVPIMIMVTWAVYRSSDLMTAQVTNEEELNGSENRDRITVRD